MDEENKKREILYNEITEKWPKLTTEQKGKWIMDIIRLQKSEKPYSLDSVPDSVLEYGMKQEKTNSSDTLISQLLAQNQQMQALMAQQQQQHQQQLQQTQMLFAALLKGNNNNTNNNQKYPEILPK